MREFKDSVSGKDFDEEPKHAELPPPERADVPGTAPRERDSVS